MYIMISTVYTIGFSGMPDIVVWPKNTIGIAINKLKPFLTKIDKILIILFLVFRIVMVDSYIM